MLTPCLLHAQTLQTILTNGPASNRLNLVFLSEGYTGNQLPNFLVDATNALNHLFACQPYQEYRTYCNAYAISVASSQSGSTLPGYGVFNNTYFNSSYDATFNYIITIPPNDRDANPADGQGKVNTLLQSLMPQAGLPILLVNYPVDGGSGGTTCIASATSALSPQLIVHESGHTLGKLGDEYTNNYANDYANYSSMEEPNTTTNSNRATLKWNAWVATNTPIPTPESPQYSTNVGLFQGAHYNASGWYRPRLGCLMQNLYSNFCEVCSETLVKAIYQKARPIDGFNPATNSAVSITNMQATSFTVTPLQPQTHSLSVQWFTNGVAITNATNANFGMASSNFPNGSYTLKALVHDLTPLVRTDPSNLLSGAVSWTVNVNVNRLQLDSARWLTNGQFTFRVSGSAPHGFVVLASTNLTSWSSLGTNNLSGGQFLFTNSAAAFNRRFYRAEILP